MATSESNCGTQSPRPGASANESPPLPGYHTEACAFATSESPIVNRLMKATVWTRLECGRTKRSESPVPSFWRLLRGLYERAWRVSYGALPSRQGLECG